MTYQELKDMLDNMPAERLSDTAMVFVKGVGEVYEVSDFGEAEFMDSNGDINNQVADSQNLIVI